MIGKAIKTILGPLARRMGTAAATALVAVGAPANTVEALMVAAGVTLALAFDIALAIYHERSQ